MTDTQGTGADTGLKGVVTKTFSKICYTLTVAIHMKTRDGVTQHKKALKH